MVEGLMSRPPKPAIKPLTFFWLESADFTSAYRAPSEPKEMFLSIIPIFLAGPKALLISSLGKGR